MAELVSVIMPSYNTASFVAESVNSVLQQTYQNWELLIVDDCSSDNSEAVLTELSSRDSRIRYFKLPVNQGSAIARNFALEKAQGRYIAFLDSDDLWVPEKLDVQISAMEVNHWPFTYTAYRRIEENGELGEVLGVPTKVSYSDLLKTCVIGCLTAIYDTKYFGKVPMPLMRKSQDYGLWLSLLKKTPYAFGVNQNLAYYRLRNNSTTANKRKAAMFTWKIYRETEGLSVVASAWYFMHYALRGYLRHKHPGVARKLGFLQSV